MNTDFSRRVALLLGWKPPEHEDTRKKMRDTGLDDCRKYYGSWLAPDGYIDDEPSDFTTDQLAEAAGKLSHPQCTIVLYADGGAGPWVGGYDGPDIHYTANPGTMRDCLIAALEAYFAAVPERRE